MLKCCGVIITTNHKTDGIYLPADDRRHYVAWSDLTEGRLHADYWNELWGWYADGGIRHVAAYLAELDLSGFDPKAPPPKTAAFWDIVDANRAPEDAELADVLDKLGNPDATTLDRIANTADRRFQPGSRTARTAATSRTGSRSAATSRFATTAAKDGLWKIRGARQVIYAKNSLTIRDRFLAVREFAGRSWYP